MTPALRIHHLLRPPMLTAIAVLLGGLFTACGGINLNIRYAASLHLSAPNTNPSVGETQAIAITIKDKDGKAMPALPASKFTWNNDNANALAMVNGQATALKAGTSNISINFGNLKSNTLQLNIRDTLAPRVLNNAPTGNAIGVNTPLELHFSESMDTTTVTINGNPNTIAGTSTWNTNKDTLTLVPGAALAYNTFYTITVAGKDLAGNALPQSTYSFTTATAPDTTAPRILNNAPTGNAIGVNTPLELEFSESMDKNTVVVTTTPNVALGVANWSNIDTTVSFAPTAPFAYATPYTITIAGKDLAGNALPQSTYSFTTAAAPDTTAPRVLTTAPSGTSVAPTNPLELEFSESMDTNTLVVTTTPSIALGAATWSNNNTKTSLAPSAALAYGTLYTITVAGKDLAGNALPQSTYSFTTAAAPDTTAPRVLTTAPSGTSVAPTNPLELEFSESMDTASVVVTTTPSIALGAATWSNNNTKVSFTPSNALAYGTAYTVTIAGKDLAGNALATSTYSFTTIAAPDTTPPTLQSITPNNTATSTTVGSNLVLNFSEAMNTASVVVAATPSLAFATPTWSNNNTQLTLTPSNPLQFATTYNLSISGKDLAGNPMTTTSSFTTETRTPTTLTITGNPATLLTGQSAALGATIKDQYGNTMSTQVTWNLTGIGNDIAVTGLTTADFRAVNPGVSTITAKASNAQATFSVRVDHKTTITFGLSGDPATFNSNLPIGSIFPGKYDLASNPSNISALQLTALCKGIWKVSNPNNTSISFDFSNNGEDGLGIVPANSSVMFTSLPNLSTTVKVYNNQGSVISSSAVVAASSAACTGIDLGYEINVTQGDPLVAEITMRGDKFPAGVYTTMISTRLYVDLTGVGVYIQLLKPWRMQITTPACSSVTVGNTTTPPPCP